MGTSKVIKGFDDAVIGMEVNEQKIVKIKPEDAYGQRDEKLVQALPKVAFGGKMDFKPGMVLAMRDPEGRIVHAFVVDMTDSEVTLDLNHPLAGKSLNFTIKVKEIE